MRRTTERVLTTHVGSLVRPPEVVDLLTKLRAGQDVDASRGRLRELVGEIVRQQVDAGLDVINDGEFGKSSFHTYMNERLTGFERQPSELTGVGGKDARDFPEFYAQQNIGLPPARPFAWTVTGPVTYRGHAAIGRDIDNLKAAAAGREVADIFMAAIAPASVTVHRIEYYASEEEGLFAIAAALHEEYKAIIDAGFILQLDDPRLAIQYDEMVPPATLADYRRWAETRIEALNIALQGLPAERIRYHLCWGSWNAPHVSDVEVKHVIDLLLRLRVGGFSLEMANPRHEHEWRLWENVKLPANCVLIPGVVSHATSVVEHPELVAERLVRLARLVGRERVIAGTDCGFAQVATQQRVHPSVMWAKLRALVEGAQLATRELWNES